MVSLPVYSPLLSYPLPPVHLVCVSLRHLPPPASSLTMTRPMKSRSSRWDRQKNIQISIQENRQTCCVWNFLESRSCSCGVWNALSIACFFSWYFTDVDSISCCCFCRSRCCLVPLLSGRCLDLSLSFFLFLSDDGYLGKSDFPTGRKNVWHDIVMQMESLPSFLLYFGIWMVLLTYFLFTLWSVTQQSEK